MWIQENYILGYYLSQQRQTDYAYKRGRPFQLDRSEHHDRRGRTLRSNWLPPLKPWVNTAVIADRRINTGQGRADKLITRLLSAASVFSLSWCPWTKVAEHLSAAAGSVLPLLAWFRFFFAGSFLEFKLFREAWWKSFHMELLVGF